MGGEDVGPRDNLVLVSEIMQTEVLEWLLKKLGPGGPHKYLPVRDVLREASWDCHISPETLRRYLVNPGPLTASNAPFRIVWRHREGDRPSRRTKYVMWRDFKVEDEDGVLESE